MPVFHKGQKHQAIFWNIFSGIGIVLLPFVIGIILTLAIIGYAAANPDAMEKARANYNHKAETFVNDNFESYEISNAENKFYLNPEKWLEMSPGQRKGMLYYLADFVTTKKGETQALITSKNREVIITKIYSTYNDEILSEFEVNKEGNNVREIIKARENFVKVNNNPKLP